MEAPTSNAPQLGQGKMVPLFVLPSATGGMSGPGATRSKYNLVLAFAGDGPQGEEYLRALQDSYSEISSEQGRVIAVTTSSIEDIRNLQARLSLTFTLLADEEGKVTRRMLGGQGMAALCVADRYGEVYFLETAPGADALPPPHLAVDWLQYILIQCPE